MSSHEWSPPNSPPDHGLVVFDRDLADLYRAEGIWSGRSLPAELMDAIDSFAANTAVTTLDRTLTYRELGDLSEAFARGLPTATALRPGDAVMFQMGNVVETVVAYLGCLLAGVRPVATLPQHGLREIALLAEHIGSSTLFVQPDFDEGRLRDQAIALVADGPIDTVVSVGAASMDGATAYESIVDAGRKRPGSDLPGVSVDPDGIVVFQLSGGTTGLPKVAPRLHEEYAYNARAWADAMGYGPTTNVVYALPLMHNAGISLGLQPALLSGSNLVLLPDAGIDGILDAVEGYSRVTIPLVPPALAVRLLENPRSAATDFSSLEHFVVGGQRLPVEVAEQLRDDLGIEVRQMFGMAEGMFTLTPHGADEFVRLHTVGAPISPHDLLRVLRPGSEEEVADGEVGELCARGPYTIRGYYRAEEHNASAFTSDGFYRTGDLSRRHRRDGQVFYSIDGRIKDVINRGVEKIHAEEVEEIIIRHRDVVNAALVAMPDRVLGERACAYLVLEGGASPITVASLGEHLLRHGLAKYKLPERVELVEDLPLTNVGKISKRVLREDIERRLMDEEAGR